jgi:voltage-gated potassium channel Kch
VFVGIIAASPVAPHLKPGAPPPTKAHYCESLCLLVWLFSGLYLFTHVIRFQSPHFAASRTLRLEESVYLISQIVTTVGYGDVTPAQVPGQLVIGFYAFVSTILVTQILSDLVNSFEDVIERRLSRALTTGEETPRTAAQTQRQKLWDAFVPVIQSGGVFISFVTLGSVFFCLYPGEGKTLGQAIYMSTITLSTVGFGAFTPVTRTGMVFAAYWMLFGVGSLGALVSARVAFSSALVRYERETNPVDSAGLINATEQQFESKMTKPGTT